MTLVTSSATPSRWLRHGRIIGVYHYVVHRPQTMASMGRDVTIGGHYYCCAEMSRHRHTIRLLLRYVIRRYCHGRWRSLVKIALLLNGGVADEHGGLR